MEIADENTVYRNKRSKPISCVTCGKEFRSKDCLTRHKNNHLGIKPFLCDICQKSFSSALALREHKACHENLVLYECPTCKRGFKHISAMLRHQSTHSKETPFECNICNRRFSLSSYLRSHMLSHTKDRKHLCSLCGKTFAHLSDLNRHKLVHSGTKPFKCAVCDVAFTDRSSCRRHEKKHATQKHQCALCNMAFKCDSSLKSHLVKKHNSGNPVTTEDEDHQVKNDISSGPGIVTDFSSNQSQPSDEPCAAIAQNHVQAGSQLEANCQLMLESPTSSSPPNFDSNCTIQQQRHPDTNQPFHLSSVNASVVDLAAIPSMKDSLHGNSQILANSDEGFESSGGDNPDYVTHPDFESQEYYNWLSSFTSLCQLESVPLTHEKFNKINLVNKSIIEALSFPSGVLLHVENFKILLSIVRDLQKILDTHITNILNHLES